MKDGLTNIGENFAAENRATLAAFAPGAAFSTVYNPMTGQFLAQPSGESRLLSGAEPQNLVPRRGGHGAVNRQFSAMTGTDPTSHVGFTLFLEEDNAITIEWRSISVNALNRSFSGDLVPEHLRPQIVEVLEQAIGRALRSR